MAFAFAAAFFSGSSGVFEFSGSLEVSGFCGREAFLDVMLAVSDAQGAKFHVTPPTTIRNRIIKAMIIGNIPFDSRPLADDSGSGVAGSRTSRWRRGRSRPVGAVGVGAGIGGGAPLGLERRSGGGAGEVFLSSFRSDASSA